MTEFCRRPDGEKYTFEDLYRIVEILRAPGGCPWDRAQTHESLVTPMLEEAYEAVDAIEKERDDKLVEELGDVLLQVVFHCIIGSEEGSFTLDDVSDSSARKMIYRHPHVFGTDDTPADEKGFQKSWDALKQAEKGLDTLDDRLKDVPETFPALYKAYKLASKIRKAGAQAEEIRGKVPEEALAPEPVNAAEAAEAVKAAEAAVRSQPVIDPRAFENEEALGRYLYRIAKIADSRGINPEMALRRYNEKVVPGNNTENTAGENA